MHKTSSASSSSIRSQLVTTFLIVGVASAVLLLLLHSMPSTEILLLSIALTGVVVVVCAFLAMRAVLTPIERLGESTESIASGASLQRLDVRLSNEIGRVAENFNALMGRIRENERAIGELREVETKLRDLERQTNELQLSYNNTVALSEIGQRITASLNLEQIVDILYSSVNSMMDASAFGLGIYNAATASIEFRLSLEKDRRVPPHTVSMSDKGSLAVCSVVNRHEIFLNDVERDYARYVATLSTLSGTSIPKSAIFCPMYVGETIIGVVCVQSFRRDAYTSYHLDMIRALASYTAVALDNTHAYEKLNTALAELKETQSQLVQSEKMASLGQLTAGIAHEINNPINFVSANVRPLQRDIASLLEVLRRYAEIDPSNGVAEKIAEIRSLRDELELDYVVEEIDQLIKGIEDGARRTAEIVRGLRNFSRVDESDLKRTNVHEGIDSTLILLHNIYKDRIEVVREYGELPEIECFPGQLNQVFMNLLTNAVQAIDGTGTITIRTASTGDAIRIEIADSGPGIPASIRERIFDPFFTTKDVGKGTGLGLSISLGIIRKHNGTIAVDSPPGGGTTFTLTLPVDHVEETEVSA
jgi:signal transduction histidine kinase/HAMP domain-containing protein